MKLLIVEGTVEEIRELLPMLQSFTSQTTILTPQPDDLKPDPSSQGSGEKRLVTEEFALRALKRRPLSIPQKTVLKALYDAHPEYLSSVALQEVLGYESNHQLAGLMGAFGRRLANTEGFQENAEFFQWQQDERTDMLEYRLAETIPEALEQAGLV